MMSCSLLLYLHFEDRKVSRNSLSNRWKTTAFDGGDGLSSLAGFRRLSAELIGVLAQSMAVNGSGCQRRSSAFATPFQVNDNSTCSLPSTISVRETDSGIARNIATNDPWLSKPP